MMHFATPIIVVAALFMGACKADRGNPSASPAGATGQPSGTNPDHAGPATRAASGSATELPARIVSFQKEIADLDAAKILAAATRDFGPPTRDIGSGLSIPQWDVAGGTLTVHPGNGPTFIQPGRPTAWLIHTENPAGQNILRGYEMFSTADPANHGTRFWIGDISFSPDLDYRFTDSQSNVSNRGDQRGNFFIQHPAGKVKITWAKGTDANTLLENAGEGEIAQLTFSDEAHAAEYHCSVVSSANTRTLVITDPHFTLLAGWMNFWHQNNRAARGKHAERNNVSSQ